MPVWLLDSFKRQTRRWPSPVELGEPSRLKRLMTKGLGALWLADGLLQLQPQMFTSRLSYDVIANALMALPSSLYFSSLSILSRFFVPYAALWNTGAAALQLLIGITLIAGPTMMTTTTKTRRLAILASIVWSAAVWVFGEGMGAILGPTMTGGIFPGTPSLLNGFPGAALIYAMLGCLLLFPDDRWRLDGRFSIVRDAPVLLFLSASLVQAAPLMWTSYGQASIFAANVQHVPDSLVGTILPLAKFTTAHPALSNSLELGACLASAYGLWVGRTWGIVLALSFLAFVWWFSLGLGGTLTGLGTDPNTPPVIMLLLLPPFIASRLRVDREGKA
jgi:hypothetical protein